VGHDDDEKSSFLRMRSKDNTLCLEEIPAIYLDLGLLSVKLEEEVEEQWHAVQRATAFQSGDEWRNDTRHGTGPRLFFAQRQD